MEIFLKMQKLQGNQTVNCGWEGALQNSVEKVGEVTRTLPSRVALTRWVVV